MAPVDDILHLFLAANLGSQLGYLPDLYDDNRNEDQR